MEEKDHQDIVELISAADKELRWEYRFFWYNVWCIKIRIMYENTQGICYDFIYVLQWNRMGFFLEWFTNTEKDLQLL